MLELLTLPVLAAGGAAAVIIPIIVNQLKKLKFIGTKYAPVAAFVVGALAGIAAHYIGLTPDMGLTQSLIVGVTLGGTSTGLYDMQKQILKK